MLFAPCCPCAALAQSASSSFETFSGFEAGGNAVSGYVGGGYAFGKSADGEGWRVRVVGGIGHYDYDGTLSVGTMDLPFEFGGRDTFLDALLGYQFRHGPLTLKLFAGVDTQDQNVSPHDPHNSVEGSAVGVKLQEEAWLDLSPRTYLQLDASYASTFKDYWSLARFGYRLRPWLSLGVEGGALGNQEYNAGRGGGFLRVDVLATELTVSGGYTGDYLQGDGGGYVEIGVYRAF